MDNFTTRDACLSSAGAKVWQGTRSAATSEYAIGTALPTPNRSLNPDSICSTPQSGFTLIELMIAVAIIGILSAIALPAYNDYIMRGKLIEASTTLSTLRANMEQYYQDNRTYLSGTAPITSPCATTALPALKNFTLTCPAASWTASTYTITATGTAGVPSQFVYTIDQIGAQTSKVSTAWDAAGTLYQCWIMKKGGTC